MDDLGKGPVVSVSLVAPRGPVVALGAHADDIEIGAGGLLMMLAARFPETVFRFVIFTGSEERRLEAAESASELLGSSVDVRWLGAPDGLLPYHDPPAAKQFLFEARRGLEPSLVLCPSLADAHQDHRFVGELAWQVFRGAWILEYEIPKWESDFEAPGFFVPISSEVAASKLSHLDENFRSQHGKQWYDRSIFESVLRLRGIQCGAELAEAFIARKTVAS